MAAIETFWRQCCLLEHADIADTVRRVHHHLMWMPLVRYRYFLEGKAASSPIAFVEMRWQSGPWIIPVALGGLICWFFDLGFRARCWILIPTGALSLIGMLYVGYVFVRTDIRRNRERSAKVGD